GVEGGPPLPGGGAGGLLGRPDAQERPNVGEQLARLDRLDQVAVGPFFQGLGAVVRIDVDGGQVQDRRVPGGRQRPQPAGDLEAVEVGQVDVEDDQVGPLAGQGQPFLGGLRLQDAVAGLAQEPAQGLAVGGVVLHVEDGGGGCRTGGFTPAFG